MRGALETCCPACGEDFKFDLDGSWEDFPCAHCATMLELEVEDWVTWGDDGEAVDDGEDFSIILAEEPS
jgi:hypothetical protein|tara:strand:- start:9 stop:215 length:207 start_codon:yes stop_codon:yes gene_type:complete